MLGHKFLLVYVIESDVYARQAIVSYLSWDRRTRVVGHASKLNEFKEDLAEAPDLTKTDVLVLDNRIFSNSNEMILQIAELRSSFDQMKILILTHEVHPDLPWSLKQAGANAYLLREEVNLSIAGAVCHVFCHDFTITNDVLDHIRQEKQFGMPVHELPERRQYPLLTNRIEQALWLCVVEGLPAELAAAEMGISTSTVRSYVKEGYRILEANDATKYPTNLSPVELAFLRLTALDIPEDPNEPPSPLRNAA